MEQELIYKNVAVIGCGASGGFVSLLLSKNPYVKVVAFDVKEPFSTLLPTGGGRCNLSYNEPDIKEFVKNYSRGEKFLLSVFSKFSPLKTRELFKELGVETYVQNDNRVFPKSDSSLKLIQQLRKHLENSNFKFVKEKVFNLQKDGEKFIVSTKNNKYNFDYVVIATGGRGEGFNFAKNLGHNIIPLKPALTALDIQEKNFYSLSGVSFKNVEATILLNNKKRTVIGDLLFTHKSISGPCVFKISSLCAYLDFDKTKTLEITFKLTNFSIEKIENLLKENQKKTIKNVFSKIITESFIVEILKLYKIDGNKQVSQIKKSEKELILNSIFNLKLHAIGRIKDSEIVTAGGVDLDEVNSKTMKSKLHKNLFFAGEVLNIDAFTGGFNLQNCWSCAYIISLNF
jgi:hypothetical protein